MCPARPVTLGARRQTNQPDETAQVLSWLDPEAADVLRRLPVGLTAELEEIRLRAGRPLHVVAGGRDWFVDPQGQPVADASLAWPVSWRAVDKTWQIACQASVYSREEESRQGFVTLPGGHRVGVAGRVLADGGRVVRFGDVGSLNFRVARSRPGCADPIMPALWDGRSRLPHHTLIVSPPGAGKTTILRDIIRQLSAGVIPLGIAGIRVAVVDERGELAGCHAGVPDRDVGPRTDVLDGCPKTAGIRMALRSLNPQVVAFDELAGHDDVLAVLEAAHAGVRVLTTAHASDPSDLFHRPSFRMLVAARFFSRVVVLGRDPRPGVVRYVGNGLHVADDTPSSGGV